MTDMLTLSVPSAVELVKAAADNLLKLPMDHPAWLPSLQLIKTFSERMEEKYALLVGPLP